MRYGCLKGLTFKIKMWTKLLSACGGTVASWLACSFPGRAVQVRAQAGDIVLCFLARHFTATMPLSTQEYKWVPSNCRGKPNKLWGVTCDGQASLPGG